MSSQSKSHPGRVLAMLPAMIAVLCTFATRAAAQDQPAPKWELYGGYSLFYPGAPDAVIFTSAWRSRPVDSAG